MTEKKPTLLAVLKKMSNGSEWTWPDFFEALAPAYVYIPCDEASDGDLVPITFRSEPGQPGYHYLFTSPKLLKEAVPQAADYGRDRGGDIFPLMARSGNGVAFNPGTPTHFNMTPEMLAQMTG